MLNTPSIETRSTTIALAVESCIRMTELTWLTYAANVAEHYERAYPPELRRVRLSDAAKPSDRMKANAQTIKRHLRVCGHEDSSTNCAADLEESLVDGLPEPHKRELKRALVRRYGFLGVDMSQEPGGNLICLQEFSHEVGDVYGAVAKALDPENATAEDRQLAAKELADVEAKARAMREALGRAGFARWPGMV